MCKPGTRIDSTESMSSQSSFFLVASRSICDVSHLADPYSWNVELLLTLNSESVIVLQHLNEIELEVDGQAVSVVELGCRQPLEQGFALFLALPDGLDLFLGSLGDCSSLCG